MVEPIGTLADGVAALPPERRDIKPETVAGARPPGRPSLYTDDLAAEICERIADGETLTAICQEPDKPNRRTVRRWMLDNEPFRLAYARARIEHAHALADEIEDKARSATKEGAANPQAIRVALDGLKWIASRVLPSAYGDRVTVEQVTKPAAELTDEELDAIIDRGRRGKAEA